jgi:hypothetical protein
MQVLFDNKLNPITTRWSFIRGDIDDIINEFLAWQEPLNLKHSIFFSKSSVNDSLEQVLLSLCPLTTTERRRYLFIPTFQNWVAFLDNGHTGTDRTIPEVLGGKLNFETVYFSHDSISQETAFDYFGKSENGVRLTRSIASINEGGWKFFQYGVPLSFEKVENYKSRQIKKRFDFSLLAEYLLCLGIDAFNEEFYKSTNAILIKKEGPLFSGTRELSIHQAQNWFRN